MGITEPESRVFGGVAAIIFGNATQGTFWAELGTYKSSRGQGARDESGTSRQ